MNGRKKRPPRQLGRGRYMPLSVAQQYLKTDPTRAVHADYYGWGWSTIYAPTHDRFLDVNPHTGKVIEHDFDDPETKARDAEARWYRGRQPKDPEIC